LLGFLASFFKGAAAAAAASGYYYETITGFYNTFHSSMLIPKRELLRRSLSSFMVFIISACFFSLFLPLNSIV